MKCPVCGESAVSCQELEDGESVTFPDIYYGPHMVCRSGNYIWAHGERQ